MEDLFFKSFRLKFFIFCFKHYFKKMQPNNFYSSLCKIYLSIHLAKREKAFTTTTYFKKIHSLPTTNKSIYWPEMVFCYQNCSDLLWDKIVLVIEKNFWNFAKAKHLQNFWDHYFHRTIYSNSERSEQFLVTECFFNLFSEVSHI